MQSKLIFKQQGQGMTEYIVIVALIAIAAIAAFQFFGQTIRTQTAGIALEISGKTADDAVTAAQGYAGQVKIEGSTKKGMDNYNANNSR